MRSSCGSSSLLSHLSFRRRHRRRETCRCACRCSRGCRSPGCRSLCADIGDDGARQGDLAHFLDRRCAVGRSPVAGVLRCGSAPPPRRADQAAPAAAKIDAELTQSSGAGALPGWRRVRRCPGCRPRRRAHLARRVAPGQGRGERQRAGAFRDDVLCSTRVLIAAAVSASETVTTRGSGSRRSGHISGSTRTVPDTARRIRPRAASIPDGPPRAPPQAAEHSRARRR